MNLKDFGGRPGAGFDNTYAMNAAAEYLARVGGGTIHIPTPGDWYMNWRCVQENIQVRGAGGKGEYDTNCVRPFRLDRPAIAFGNGSDLVRYCGLVDVHVSGTDRSSGCVKGTPGNAPQALLLAGGVVNFHAVGCVFYNGVQTVALVPSPRQPVTVTTFTRCTIRNDLADNPDARAIFIARRADPGYATSNKFINTKVNGPRKGFAAEFAGTVSGVAAEVNDSYWDIWPGHGVLLTGSNSIVCYDWQLDPGENGAVIIETDQANPDPARYISGLLRGGGQKFKSRSGVVEIPPELEAFHFRSRLVETYLGGTVYIAPPSEPFRKTTYFDLQGTSGPFRLNGMDLHAKATTEASSLTTAALATSGGIAAAKGVRVGGDLTLHGGNASPAGRLSSGGPEGGLRIEAIGPHRDLDLAPSGDGTCRMGGAGTIPGSDNSKSLGASDARWSTIYSGTGAIHTSDEREKQDIEAIPPAWLEAWGDVEWCRFRHLDAVRRKGRSARWHVGLVAQRVRAAFEARGIDPFAIGLLCRDEVEGGDRYGIRYDEALALECAYLRALLSR